MIKKVTMVAVCVAVIFAVYLSVSTLGVKTAVPTATAAPAKTYTGIVYVAGMGGHFAAATVSIDPSKTDSPISISGLDRVVIGDKSTHPTHDARIDASDKNIMFWSTYKQDKDGNVHVGKTDLKTGNVIKDVALGIDTRAKGPAPMYCASGQSKTSFIPVTMATEAYIDVFDKNTLEKKARVFLDELGYKAGTYKFFHGVNTPDMKGFIVSINMVADGKGTGKIDLVLLDMAELEKGKVKVINKATLTGDPAKTVTFRQTYTADGKYLLQSAADRMYLVDAKTLKLVDEEMMVDGENHDVMPTPDGKFAILTLRKLVPSGAEPEGKSITDGMVQLYDMSTKKLVGKSVSVCYDCHKNAGIHGNSVLCGLDANLK